MQRMVMSKDTTLRKLLDRKGLLVAPGVYDALTAKVAQYTGFQALYMTGYGTSAAYGYPDIGLLTMTEMLENLRRVCAAVDIPVIADADTGYGSFINVYRTVHEYEKAGAAAIQLEDQAWPKRSAGMEGRKVIAAREMVEKIKAAVDARVSAETVLVIRTDAIATHGFKEALERGKTYAESGADVLFIEAPATDEQVRQIPRHFSKPCLLNKAHSAHDLSLKTLEEMGYAIVIFPSATLLGAIEGSFRMCKSLLEEGKQMPVKDLPGGAGGLNQFFGLERYRELERKFF
jgi:2-methylisocitrate lyase-like PEP mutase family enzyme